MLGLQLPTIPGGGARRVQHPGGLTDHAWCERVKAASNAISTIVRYPELTDLVEELTRIAMEEMEHFGMVVEKIKARGWVLGKERKDPYIHDPPPSSRRAEAGRSSSSTACCWPR